MIDHSDVTARHANAILEDLARLRRRSRRAGGLPWFPLLCFGALTMLSAAAIALAGGPAVIVLWIVGGLAALLSINRHYAERPGASGHDRQMWVSSLGFFVACFLAAVMFGGGGGDGGQAGAVTAPVIVVIAGYAMLGWIQRRLAAPLTVLVAALPSLALSAAGAGPWPVELAFGAGLVGAGLVLARLDGRGQ